MRCCPLCVVQDPGPDLLVCDEAHTIKNTKALVTQALMQVRTKRRIALTGSPLQNNLTEYYCVSAARDQGRGPGLLPLLCSQGARTLRCARTLC